MPKRSSRIPALSRRERQVMDILFRRGEATAAEVMAELPDPPTYSSVRSILTILVEKEHVVHREEGLRYVYLPEVPRHTIRRSALRHLVDTFFEGSAEKVVAALLGEGGGRLSDDELERIAQRVARARTDTGLAGANPHTERRNSGRRSRREDGSK